MCVSLGVRVSQPVCVSHTSLPSHRFHRIACSNKLTACLAGLDDLKHQASDVHIPMALLDVVEAGANPDLFLRDLVQTLTDKNQKSNGRVQSIRVSSRLSRLSHLSHLRSTTTSTSTSTTTLPGTQQ
ncbi:hypothetical protein BC831DRAFT_514423 [Entophlyctis helioformis]|nr:hypothetical protein BC831DRAFT_514423 [Entophlyctis helioformis]